MGIPREIVVPGAGVLLGGGLLLAAALRYPGGFGWGEHTVSMLAAPRTAAGLENTARPFAVAGVLCLTSGMALLFHGIARSAGAVWHRKAVQIGGIGAMVYASLLVTPMHDLMVTLSLAFFAVLLAGVLHMLWVERRGRLLALGLVSLILKGGTAMLYYADVGVELIPAWQKISMLFTVAWLFAVRARGRLPGERPSF